MGASKTATIAATDEHPFWVDGDNRWVYAKDLKPGYRFQTSDDRSATAIGTRTWNQHQTVYNLTVDGLHTYYVIAGSTPVLVHNCGGSVGGHRTICDCANGGTSILQRGPKPFGTGAHNQKIAEVAGQVDDGVIIGGGQ